MSAPRPRVFRAPGRVNLIGEHTDYSGGFVLPVALDLACEVGAAPSPNGRLRVRSIDLGREVSWEVEQIDAVKPRGEWSDYVVGVALQLAKRGVAIPTGELAVSSTVPLGAGLSSSAALEVGVGLALLGLADRTLPREELAQACQAAEVEFVGLQCGIMDQFASLFGKRDHAILIDCRSLDHSLVALPPDLEIVVVDSGVKHELATSAYNQRQKECRAAAELAGTPLRDITVEEWPEIEPQLPEPLRKRARHVVFENERTIEFVAASETRNMPRLGKLMAASHASLSENYEVSCEELDFLAATAQGIEGVVGARMTGGGFGGCTVNLVQVDHVSEFRSSIADAYRKRFDRDAKVYLCKSADGAGEVVAGA